MDEILSSNLPQMDRVCELMKKVLIKRQKLRQDAPVQVIPGLYIGNYTHAIDKQMIQNLSITLVISCLKIQDKDRTQKAQYKQCLVRDHPDQKISRYFQQIGAKIDYHLKNGKSCLVNCFSAKSRSPTLVLAYLIKKNNLNFQNALSLLKQKCPSIEPNKGFISQLKQYSNQQKQTKQKIQIIIDDTEYEEQTNQKDGGKVNKESTQAISQRKKHVINQEQVNDNVNANGNDSLNVNVNELSRQQSIVPDTNVQENKQEDLKIEEVKQEIQQIDGNLKEGPIQINTTQNDGEKQKINSASQPGQANKSQDKQQVQEVLLQIVNISQKVVQLPTQPQPIKQVQQQVPKKQEVDKQQQTQQPQQTQKQSNQQEPHKDPNPPDQPQTSPTPPTPTQQPQPQTQSPNTDHPLPRTQTPKTEEQVKEDPKLQKNKQKGEQVKQQKQEVHEHANEEKEEKEDEHLVEGEGEVRQKKKKKKKKK